MFGLTVPRFAVVTLLIAVLTACSVDPPASPTHGSAPASPQASSTAAEAQQTPSVTTGQSPLPSAFPPLLEEAQIDTWVNVMVRIHVETAKNRQQHEVMPKIVKVTKKADCQIVPGQAATQQVGDRVSSGLSPEIAPCLKDGTLAVFYAPHRLYELSRDNNPLFMQDVLRGVVRDYLALLTQHKLNDLDRRVTACVAGRMIGGLRDAKYLTVNRANALELSSPDDNSEWAQIFKTARDTGDCPSRWLAWN